MADPIPVAFKSEFGYKHSTDGQARVWIDPAQTRNATYSSGDCTHNLLWALVLNRKDPTKPPLFNQTLSSNTDLPDELKKALKSDGILFFSMVGFGTNAPQGALYTALADAGAGAQLQKREALASYKACGLLEYTIYMLVSLPGTGLGGNESQTTAQNLYTPDNPNPDAMTLPLETLLFNLVAHQQGHTPIPIGS